jgi:alpha-tubulin suppressor-like RCC1 family protein
MAGMCNDPIVAIDCGSESTMALRSSGSVVYWGRGGVYSAGPDTVDYRPLPSYLVGPSEIELRMGRGCAMVAGERRCWGAQNHAGYSGTDSSVLGDGLIADVVVPAPLAARSLDDVAFGLMHTCGVRSGQVLCWGGPMGPGFRALGDGLATSTTTPITVLGLMDAIAVEAGTQHTCAIRMDGRVVCWGENGARLGIGTAGPRDSPLEDVELMDGTPLTDVVELAIGTGNAIYGGTHTCARRGDRTVMCWGENGHGNGTGSRGTLGIDDGVTSVSIPYAVSVVSGPGSTTALSGAVRIAAGYYFTCAELDGGSLVCWGNNDRGQLGLGTTVHSSAPVPVPIPAFRDWCVGDDHACALLRDGSVRCWGSNDYGQCGQDGVTTVLSPTEVVPLRRGPSP